MSVTKKRWYTGQYKSAKKVGVWTMWEECNGDKMRLQNEDWVEGILQNVRDVAVSPNNKSKMLRN